MRKLTITTTSVMLLFCLCVSTTAAASRELIITPAILTLEMDPGQAVNTKVTLVNTTAEPKLLKLKLRSFDSGDNEGTPLLDDTLQSPLHEWLQPLPSELTVPANSPLELKFTVHVPATAGPGSYRTALLFQDITPVPSGGTSAIAAEFGPLVFVRVSGETVEQATIASFAAVHSLQETLPAHFTIGLSNSGNVDLMPVGVINIYPKLATDSTTVSFDFNPTSARILAGNQRSYSSVWSDLGIHAGYYEAEVVLAYGQDHKVLTAKTSFWVIPWKLILAIAVPLILIILLRMLWRRFRLRHRNLL